ncbi:MAG: hypothetical protein FWF18_04340 [Dehalococcoidia bacterium]|nr:hypothetical protein [Dehalococcoidia bacterium]
MVSFQPRTSPSCWGHKAESNQFSVVSYEFGVMSLVQVHPGGSVATEGSGGGEQSPTTPPDASLLAGSFLQHGFMIKFILDGAQRPKDLVAGCQLLLPTPPDASSLASSFLQHGFTSVLNCGSVTERISLRNAYHTERL